jgi:hypothetical protein
MIRQSMPSGHDPMGGSRFSEKIMLKINRRDHDPIYSDHDRAGYDDDATPSVRRW